MISEVISIKAKIKAPGFCSKIPVYSRYCQHLSSNWTSLFNLSPNITSHFADLYSVEIDAKSLYNDWVVVGSDLKNAINKLKNNGK